jgi:hypothetical protein
MRLWNLAQVNKATHSLKTPNSMLTLLQSRRKKERKKKKKKKQTKKKNPAETLHTCKTKASLQSSTCAPEHYFPIQVQQVTKNFRPKWAQSDLFN